MDIDVICKFRNKSKFNIINNENIKIVSTKFNKKKLKFNFNEVWDDNDSYEDIYSFIDKNSVNYRDKNIILFGYSGSGKTYTMTNILKEIINDFLKKDIKYKISSFQIYNNHIFDILDNNNKLKFFKNNQLSIKNPTKKYFETFEEFENLMNNNRKINKTDNNDISSRSCLIIKINSLLGNFNIIDMHGQEIGNPNNNNILSNEAKNINLNMLALKNCIIAYYKKNKYIPFRDSLLTLYLKNMFTSVCKVYFICTINSDHQFYQQLDSMKYASCLVHPKKNIKYDIQNLLIEYSLYITTLSLNNHDNNTIFKQIRKNDYSGLDRINELIISNMDAIKIFNQKYNDFMNNIKANDTLKKIKKN